MPIKTSKIIIMSSPTSSCSKLDSNAYVKATVSSLNRSTLDRVQTNLAERRESLGLRLLNTLTNLWFNYSMCHDLSPKLTHGIKVLGPPEVDKHQKKTHCGQQKVLWACVPSNPM